MRSSWERFQRYSYSFSSVGIRLDISRMNFEEPWLETMSVPLKAVFAQMGELESGALANPDEQRMVGHYWLRNSALAPTPEIAAMIEEAISRIQTFAQRIHEQQIRSEQNLPFQHVLLIGIGGSVLGPQLSHRVFLSSQNPLKFHFLDNTDPEGIHLILDLLKDFLAQTLVIVISKTGKTKETRNCVLEVQDAYQKQELRFGAHAIAITQPNSDLEQLAQQEQWLARFPLWDWVGGRTSITSSVGLLQAALQGVNIDEFLQGCKVMDDLTRNPSLAQNPAALLALMWLHTQSSSSPKDMVILPYKDRLEWFGRYLQQLVMESLGKETDLTGKPIHAGIVVYGNKGSTDQHAYVQQLREGPNNFFVTFIEILKDQEGQGLAVEPRITSGDYLNSFLLGTREALSEKNRESLTITLEALTPKTFGGLLALFERAVGFYALLIHINAYHQPGVEAGKRAANRILEIQGQLLTWLEKHPQQTFTIDQLHSALKLSEQQELIFKILEHLSTNQRVYRVSLKTSPFECSYQWKGE